MALERANPLCIVQPHKQNEADFNLSDMEFGTNTVHISQASLSLTVPHFFALRAALYSLCSSNFGCLNIKQNRKNGIVNSMYLLSTIKIS